MTVKMFLVALLLLMPAVAQAEPWAIRKQVDPITDEVWFFASVAADNSSLLSNEGTFVLWCPEGEEVTFSMKYTFTFLVQRSDYDVVVRFDKAAPIAFRGTRSIWENYIDLPIAGIGNVKVGRMVFRHKRTTGVFDLSGIQDTIDLLHRNVDLLKKRYCRKSKNVKS